LHECISTLPVKLAWVQLKGRSINRRHIKGETFKGGNLTGEGGQLNVRADFKGRGSGMSVFPVGGKATFGGRNGFE
jgi:hypothetical protein